MGFEVMLAGDAPDGLHIIDIQRGSVAVVMCIFEDDQSGAREMVVVGPDGVDHMIEIDPAVNLRMQKNLQMSIQLRDPAATS